MKKKELSEYTQEEKEELLVHWWHYYGKDLYSLGELEKFQELVRKDSDFVFSFASICFADEKGPKPFLDAIRNNKIKQLQQYVSSYEDSLKDTMPLIKEFFLKEILDTYNHKESDIPMEEDYIKRQLEDMNKRQEAEKILNPERVVEIYKKCLFKEEEIENNGPTSEYTMATGVVATTVFNTKRLNENKSDINKMIDMIENIQSGPHFTALCTDKYGRLWTGEHKIVDQLMVLGLATELLSVPLLPRDMWYLFPESLPYVVKINKNVDTLVKGIDPSICPPQKKKI